MIHFVSDAMLTITYCSITLLWCLGVGVELDVHGPVACMAGEQLGAALSKCVQSGAGALPFQHYPGGRKHSVWGPNISL